MNNLRVVGVLSGTSIDAIDVCVVDFSTTSTSTSTSTSTNSANSISLKLIVHDSEPFDAELRERLLKLCRCVESDSRAVCRANFDVATAFGNAINAVLRRHNIDADSIDCIGSHGQTIWHEVVNRQTHSTLQIGDGSVIAQLTRITTLFNFRTADVAAGGGGAPLVPVLDNLLLRPTLPIKFRVLQNIGGISNSCVLSSDRSIRPIAFDSGPGNVFIDECVRLLFNQRMDNDGAIARRGVVCKWLLDELLSLSYFALPPPKSTGRELFSVELCNEFIQKAKAKNVSNEDILNTFTELTAFSIVDALKRFGNINQLDEIYIAGGGCRNRFLFERIEFHCHSMFGKTTRVLPHSLLLDGDAKESVLFAFLAYMTVRGIAVGSNDSLLGQIAPSSNYLRLMNKIVSK